MPALMAGTVAPDFALKSVDGETIKLRDALKRGPVVAAFFKISCPVCQLAFPYLDRLHKAYGDRNLTIVGISQNGGKETKQFMEDYGVSFPVLLDDRASYQVSNAYGLTNVPSLFYIARDGGVEQSIVGWSHSEMDELNGRIAHAAGVTRARIFHPGEDVPEFKAG